METFGNKPIEGLTKGEQADEEVDLSGVINSVLKIEGNTFERDEVLATLDTKRLVPKQREDPHITQRNILMITEFPDASARLIEASITELVESSITRIREGLKG